MHEEETKMNLSTLINDGFFAYTMYQTARQPKFYVHLPWRWFSPPAKEVIRNACMVGYSGMLQLLRMSNIMWQAETLRESLPPNIPVDVYALALSSGFEFSEQSWEEAQEIWRRWEADCRENLYW